MTHSPHASVATVAPSRTMVLLHLLLAQVARHEHNLQAHAARNEGRAGLLQDGREPAARRTPAEGAGKQREGDGIDARSGAGWDTEAGGRREAPPSAAALSGGEVQGHVFALPRSRVNWHAVWANDPRPAQHIPRLRWREGEVLRPEHSGEAVCDGGKRLLRWNGAQRPVRADTPL